MVTVTCNSAFSSMSPSPPAGDTIFFTKRFPSTPKEARMSAFVAGEKRMSAICAVCPRKSARLAVSLCSTRTWPARRP